MCFNIAKLWCFGLQNWVFLFSLICPCMLCLKEKYAKKNKSKKNQNAFKYGFKHVSRRCRSYKIYLECDSPHQLVMIVCECIWSSHISNLHNMRHIWTLAMFHTQHANSLLLLIHVQVQCDLAITRNTCVNIYSLNCLNLFLKYKIN